MKLFFLPTGKISSFFYSKCGNTTEIHENGRFLLFDLKNDTFSHLSILIVFCFKIRNGPARAFSKIQNKDPGS